MSNILLVDDESDILETLPSILQKWGHTTFIADNGFKALKVFEENEVDVILSDIKMPELNGMELLQKVQEIDKRCIVVFMTGYPSEDSAITAMRAGAYDYLVKPVNIDELRLRIDRALEQKNRYKTLPLIRGINWALLVSIPLWIIIGFVIAKLLNFFN